MEFCYILKLQDHDVVKIGITKNIQSRIVALEKDLGCDFDLMNSHLFTSTKSKSIRSLEHQLLHDTINDQLKRDHPFNLPEKSRIKYTEIRKSDNVQTVVDLLNKKIKLLNLPVNYFEGIDISGFQSKIIPQEIIPFEYPIEDWYDVFQDQFIELMETEKRNPLYILQDIIYLGLCAKGVKIEVPKRKRKENCYYA